MLFRRKPERPYHRPSNDPWTLMVCVRGTYPGETQYIHEVFTTEQLRGDIYYSPRTLAKIKAAESRVNGYYRLDRESGVEHHYPVTSIAYIRVAPSGKEEAKLERTSILEPE